MTVFGLIWVFLKLTNSIFQKMEIEIVRWTDQSDSLIIISSFGEAAVYSTFILRDQLWSSVLLLNGLSADKM